MEHIKSLSFISMLIYKPLLFMVTLLILFISAGCIELVTDIEFPEQDPKVVAHSFISPADTAVMVLLTWSKPISKPSGERINFIDNAQVQIHDANKNGATLNFCPDRQIYSIAADLFPIHAGQSYRLQIDVPGYSTITSTAYVPFANNSLTFEKLDTVHGSWSSRLVIEYAFTDAPGTQENFYAPGAYRQVAVYDWLNDTTRLYKQLMYPVSGDQYIRNRDREGNRFLMRAETYYYDEYDNSSDHPDGAGDIFLLLLTTDEHYYRYHKALEYYYPDDFFAEPIHIYTNIEGGLGVFAGYNQSVLIVAQPSD